MKYIAIVALDEVAIGIIKTDLESTRTSAVPPELPSLQTISRWAVMTEIDP